MNIEGSVAFVTGANHGLGKAYAEALLAAGTARVSMPAPVTVFDHRSAPDPHQTRPTSPEDSAAAVRDNPGALAAQMQAIFDAGPSWAA